MNEYYTYLYCDPITNEPFYVGKGKGPRARSGWHNKSVEGHIRNLNGAHTIRAMTGLTEKRALFLEQMLIWLFGRKNLGTGNLLNFTDGGQGISGRAWTPEMRAKSRLSHLNWRQKQAEESFYEWLGTKHGTCRALILRTVKPCPRCNQPVYPKATTLHYPRCPWSPE